MHGWQPASSRPPVCSLCVFTAPCVCDHGPRVGVTAPCMCMFTAPCVGVCVCSLPPVCVHCPLCVCAFTAPCVCACTAPCVCIHTPCVSFCRSWFGALAGLRELIWVALNACSFLLAWIHFHGAINESTHLGCPECVLILISMDSLSWYYQ